MYSKGLKYSNHENNYNIEQDKSYVSQTQYGKMYNEDRSNMSPFNVERNLGD
jgi:hypothetical protein